MKKQILSLFLCFCLILGCMPAAVRAEGEQHIFFKGVERDDVSENWFVDSTVRPLTSRSFYVDFNYGLQFVDEDGTLITGDIGDIEVDDETVCTVEEMGRLDNCFLIVGNAAGSATITISAGGTVYQDTITVEDLPDDPSDPGSGDDPSGHGSNDSACHLETFTLDGKDYAVGFGFERDGGMLDLYGSGHSGPSSEYELMSGGSYGEGEWDQFDYGLFVARISGTEGGNTIYSDVTNQMDFEITKIWLDLDTATGDRDTFSLARGSQQVTALTEDIANPPLIYYDKSHAGSVQVHANVLAEGTSYEVWFTVTCLEKVTQTIDLSSAASIHEINQILEAYEKSRDSVFIQLGAKEYGGPGDDPAIIIPDLSDDWSPSAITVLGEKGENGSTVINGGIVLESSAAGFISEVTLKARTEGEGTGITSVSGTGPYNLYACDFYDFDTAVDSTNSFIGATQDNYFEHNAVALKIALKDEGCNQDQLEGNSFFENGTAVLVTSLNDFITPYYFRLRDGQFIGNGTDFDISQEGEYYFYRNQFAADGATLRRPVIAEHPDVILHCYPARDLSGDLVLDQDDNTILNDQAGELQIKVSQLGGHKLTIVTDDGTGSRIAGYIDALLASAGTTSLPSGLRSAASSAEGEATFTPSLDVTRETDAVTAVLAEVPQGLTLRVSIPDIEWEEVTVTHNGEELEGVTVENGTVTFPAEDGGSYVIAAKTEEAETPEDPDTPSEPDTPPTPSRPSGGSTPAEEPEEPAPEEPGEPSEEELAEAAAEKFDDVEADDWFAEAVGYAVEKGFVAGTGEKTFSPDMLLTRGMLVQMLYGIAGTPDAGAGTDFSDVEDSDWYAEAVAWASENGIAAGYGEAFGPEDPVTREQMVTMLLAYAKFMGYEIVEGADLSAYADEDAISTWAENAMAWAKAADLVSGRSETMLVPSGNATRAETVVILMNFLRFVAE